MLGQLLSLAVSSSISQLWLPAHPKRRWSWLWEVCSQQCLTLLVARPATMKTQRQSPRLALWLSAMQATRWCRLGFQVEHDAQDQRDFANRQRCWLRSSLDLTCMKCDKRGSVAQLPQHLHNLSGRLPVGLGALRHQWKHMPYSAYCLHIRMLVLWVYASTVTPHFMPIWCIYLHFFCIFFADVHIWCIKPYVLHCCTF